MKSKKRRTLVVGRYAQDNTVMEECKGCGRTFYPGRLEVHMKSCVASNNPVVSRHRNSGLKQSPINQKKKGSTYVPPLNFDLMGVDTRNNFDQHYPSVSYNTDRY